MRAQCDRSCFRCFACRCDISEYSIGLSTKKKNKMCKSEFLFEICPLQLGRIDRYDSPKCHTVGRCNQRRCNNIAIECSCRRIANTGTNSILGSGQSHRWSCYDIVQRYQPPNRSNHSRRCSERRTNFYSLWQPE